MTNPIEMKKNKKRIIRGQKEYGFFSYSDTGFVYDDGKLTFQSEWDDIQTIFGYKEDRLTTDDICMDIFSINRSCFKLSESVSGWYQFNQHLKKNIPLINENWENEIIIPPFELKLTLLFDKQGRKQEQVETQYYEL